MNSFAAALVLSATASMAQHLRGSNSSDNTNFQLLGVSPEEEPPAQASRLAFETNLTNEIDVWNSTTLDSLGDTTDSLLSLSSEGCLCVFDLDCTLSSRPHGHVQLSSMGLNFRQSFCSSCHLAVITAASKRPIAGIHEYVSRCDGSCKARKASQIAASHGVHSSNVYFFDDSAHNVAGFRGTGMNARQVSCGRCGASDQDIQKACGVILCR
mmetsp:Transcript_71754/g.126665  ORF Transcript_71754/g.126665 Transcript_71754/m.126665 type:complete len:212 (-) Transcript_71754:140-775(-)|eukprot:CAMPEP_0197652686 /NCGR_PEP_ID=MMETSP1338-20131121/34601_1 /TAXON_ID=43686 ORGANISM="Pelagodinium beii, Strain RCC1491" /NCGR_SAMPLE_ID=MMETSP1338 /ASSEMBLY_ACC=CAM_ASM_000754 /LENGTH=211 /DNA_ID=CAMNT_0043227617 /DNA_START=72 /DNA_END=707 /DNA_ORIENTATION=-